MVVSWELTFAEYKLQSMILTNYALLFYAHVKILYRIVKFLYRGICFLHT